MKLPVAVKNNCFSICDHISNHSSSNYGYVYDCMPDRGLQVCFEALIKVNVNDALSLTDDYYIDHPLGKRISRWLPVELFLGKREGEHVDVMINDKPVTFICAQLKYGDAKPFEERLYEHTKSFGGICGANYYTPPLSGRLTIFIDDLHS